MHYISITDHDNDYHGILEYAWSLQGYNEQYRVKIAWLIVRHAVQSLIGMLGKMHAQL